VLKRINLHGRRTAWFSRVNQRCYPCLLPSLVLPRCPERIPKASMSLDPSTIPCDDNPRLNAFAELALQNQAVIEGVDGDNEMPPRSLKAKVLRRAAMLQHRCCPCYCSRGRRGDRCRQHRRSFASELVHPLGRLARRCESSSSFGVLSILVIRRCTARRCVDGMIIWGA
jgi:hypothetical protein